MGRKKKIVKKKILIKGKKQNKILPKKVITKSTFKTGAEKIPIKKIKKQPLEKRIYNIILNNSFLLA